jgi:hypothetical protein
MPIATAMSWAGRPRNILICQKYSWVAQLPTEQRTVCSRSVTALAAARALSTSAWNVPTGVVAHQITLEAFRVELQDDGWVRIASQVEA